jgi:hypothetical protein
MAKKIHLGEDIVSISFNVTPEQRDFIESVIMKVDSFKKGDALFRLCKYYAMTVEGIDFTPNQDSYKRIIGPVKPKDIMVKELNLKLAKKIIIGNHYSHSWPNTSVALGYYARNKLIGVVCFGVGANKSLIPSVCKGVNANEGFELVRLFAFDWAPRNIESFMISQSIKYLQKNYPQIKVLVSFADPAQGHLGIIYQATNWIYTGKGKGEFFFRHNGKVIHPRTLSDYPKEKRMKIRRNPKSRVWKEGKHRYVYLLGSRKQRKLLKRCLRLPRLPYPKSLPIREVKRL